MKPSCIIPGIQGNENLEEIYLQFNISSSDGSLPLTTDRVAECLLANMTTTKDEPYLPYEQRPETYIVPVVFALIFVVGAAGNGCLIFAFARYPQLRNVPNTYIISLALGDLLVILCSVPFVSTIYTMMSWPYGEFVCRVQEAVRDVSVGVTVFTLTALSADRYLAIVDPLRRRGGVVRSSRRVTLAITLTIWLLSLILAVPAAIFSHVTHFSTSDAVEIKVCYPFPAWMGNFYPKANILAKLIVYYAGPLLIIATFYALMARHLVKTAKSLPGEASAARQKQKHVTARKKVAKMVLSFVVIFAICFFPNNVFLVWFYFNPRAEDEYNQFWNVFRIVGFCLGFLNSCINPIALYCISGTFRKYFNRHLFCCLCPASRQRFCSTIIQSHSFTGRRFTSTLRKTEEFSMTHFNAGVGHNAMASPPVGMNSKRKGNSGPNALTIALHGSSRRKHLNYDVKSVK
ncbi:neuropeptide CCHamide-1 receptor-like [Oratosquilla oratoria]|uniref:neuropeptide CCHamide-1 receptor-like n=1 Tax=Oratosquilla oratoria TaxID=337810 RepID=UPI003F75F5EC